VENVFAAAGVLGGARQIEIDAAAADASLKAAN
jgi:hypothetical protein